MIVSSYGPNGYKSVSREMHPAKLKKNGGQIDIWFTDSRGESVWLSLLDSELRRALDLEHAEEISGHIEFDTPI